MYFIQIILPVKVITILSGPNCKKKNKNLLKIVKIFLKITFRTNS